MFEIKTHIPGKKIYKELEKMFNAYEFILTTYVRGVIKK